MNNSEIIKELDLIKDDPKYTERAIDLFYRIQLAHGPLIEVITIFRFEKPRLYSILKTRFESKPRFKMLFQVIIQHEFARNSLGFEILTITN
jgi:sulfite reductase alpha subunit-like flavoprotein